MESNDNRQFMFDLLDDINKRIRCKSHPNDDFLSVSEIQTIVDKHLSMKKPRFTNHSYRMLHFILYLNTEIENCSWVKDEPSLNLNRYVHGKALTRNTYYKLVDILNLKSFVEETIMYTPYSFCRDLVDITLNKIKAMDGISQLSATENLILALFKCVRRGPIKSNFENPLVSHFNQAMLVFGKDYLPHDIRRLDFEDEQKEISRYNGYRVKSIFKILVEVIRYKSTADSYRQYPMYKLKSLRSVEEQADCGSSVFKKFFDVIMFKCMNMCNFSIDTWLSWYEIEVIEEDTNLQSAIGHLCYELCNFIDNGIVNENHLMEFRPILRNISIEKIDFTDIDVTDIDKMVDCIEKSSKFHLSGWIKKMIENPNVFNHSRAIQILNDSIENIDYNCFKCIIDSSMAYYRNGGIILEIMGHVLYKGIKHLDIEDKMCMLRHLITNHAENAFYLTTDFEEILCEVAQNEFNEDADQKEVMTKLIWLVMQQPRKMLRVLISQYVHGICGLPIKGVECKRSCLHRVLVDIHLNMNPSYIFEEYTAWLDFKSSMSEDDKQCLRQWIFGSTRTLRLIKPKVFLANVITPLLVPSSNYEHMIFLISLTKFFLTECQLMTLPDIDVWDTLLIQLAKILEDARWTRENYSTIRVELCESLIMTIQPLLHYASFIIKPNNLDSIKQQLSKLHLINSSHFLRLFEFSIDYITLEGMDEQFIMTVQSQSHISYSNLNGSSTQRSQEEFIFSIATYMPRFTLHEMKSFVANYLCSAKVENIVEASFFLFDCFMNAMMRIIVYLKTAVQNESYNEECAYDNLDNTIVNFLDVVNTSKMCCIYDEEINPIASFNTITKIVMVVKQMENSRQVPLLVVIRRLIHTLIPISSAEIIMKILTVLASMKSQNAKKLLGGSIDSLAQSLAAAPSQG